MLKSLLYQHDLFTKEQFNKGIPMIKHYVLFTVLIITSCFNSFAQRYHYEGGFFEKTGNQWHEFKDDNPNRAVNWFNEIGSDDNFYIADNGKCKIAIPKNTQNNFLIQLNGHNDWTYKYMSKDNAISNRYHYEGGFFVKKGNQWYEFKDEDPSKAVNWFNEIVSDDNFFVGDNGNCKIAIPRNMRNNFLIQLKGESEWLFKYKNIGVRQSGTNKQYAGNKKRNSSAGNQGPDTKNERQPSEKTASKAGNSIGVPSVTIEKITSDSNAEDPAELLQQINSFGYYQVENYGIAISVKVAAYNMLNKNLNVNAYFYDLNKNKLKDKNNRYCTQDKQVAISEKFKPGNVEARKDIHLFIPYSELHCQKGKNNSLLFTVGIFDNQTGERLAISDYYNITFRY